jgi:hypothetical protein
MSLLRLFARKPTDTERRLIQSETENLFLRDKAEAAVMLAVETGVRNAALEAELQRLRRPQRERRRDDAGYIAERNATTDKLRAELGRAG